MERRKKTSIVRLGLTALLTFAGCGSGGTDKPTPPPKVLFVMLDTVRADHVGVYGSGKGITPSLDTFAAAADRYSKMYSAAPWTLPSQASMFTGLFPYEHGARTFPVQKKKRNVRPLVESHYTLAEFFQDRGSGTAAFGANKAYLFNPRYGLDQGFETFQLTGPTAGEVNTAAVSWLKENGEKPFFLFLNYMDTHRPYNLGGAVVEGGDLSAGLDSLAEAVMGSDSPPPEDLLRTVRENYRRAVENLDAGLGSLFDALRELSLYEETLVLIVADHGEFLGEHRLVEHSKDIYQEVLHVPLLVKAPFQKKGRVIDTPVSSVDVPDIILSGVGLEREAREGAAAAFPAVVGAHPIMSENYYTRLKDLFDPRWGDRFRRVRRALFSGDYKFIHSSDGMNELYNLAEDPAEQHNLIEREAEEAERMAASLKAFLDTLVLFEPEESGPPMTDAEKERMRALGYL